MRLEVLVLFFKCCNKFNLTSQYLISLANVLSYILRQRFWKKKEKTTRSIKPITKRMFQILQKVEKKSYLDLDNTILSIDIIILLKNKILYYYRNFYSIYYLINLIFKILIFYLYKFEVCKAFRYNKKLLTFIKIWKSLQIVIYKM